MIESDLVETIIGMGPNLFYNSSMVSCILICNKNKSLPNKILFIDAVDEIRKEKTMSYLNEEHISCIVSAYKEKKDIPRFCKIVSTEDILKNGGNLSVQLYVKRHITNNHHNDNLKDLVNKWDDQSKKLKANLTNLLKVLSND